MEPIRAFVGHSFLESDKPLVDRFLTFLTSVREVHPHFSWEHAEHPEARGVDEKVLARFANKNLFIGICTPSERVINPEALRASRLTANKLVGEAGAFLWKTSDWVIQEIGLAVGRDMRIILLLEAGTRPPGALQGTLEYIQFELSAPERCFPKLLAMIGSLTPKVDGTPTETVARAPESEPEAPTSEWNQPRPDWKLRDYERAIFFAVLDDDAASEEKISTAFLTSPAGADEIDRRKWEAVIEYHKIGLDKNGNLTRLKELAEKSPAIGIVWANLGRAYRQLDEHLSAARAVDQAIAAETDPLYLIRFLGEGAVEYYKAGDHSQADSLLARMRGLADGGTERESEILAAELEFADAAGESQVYVACLERLLEIDPGDIDRRFSLAYKYADIKMDADALFHYLKIPRSARTQTSWNNLGVSYSEVGMPGRSVDAYREGERLGGTLAMANLAGKLTDAGFFEEAGEILATALKVEDHHKNVDTALATLKGAPEKEDKKLDEVFGKASRLSEYYRNFGRSLACPDVDITPSNWRGPQFQVAVARQHPKEIVFSGSYEVDRYGALAAALMGPGFLGSVDPGKDRYLIEYRGVTRGRTTTGKVTRTKQGEKPRSSLLGGTDQETTFLMWLSEDGNAIAVLERSSNAEPRLYSLTRM
jgi:tetratricopeptide (TPR) repeat protein